MADKKQREQLRRKRISRSLKKYNAKIKRIQKLEKVNRKKAIEISKRALIETIREASAQVAVTFFEIKPGVFRRIKPGTREGQEAKHLIGPRRSEADVMRSRGVAAYWAAVKSIQAATGWTLQQTRAEIRKKEGSWFKVAKSQGLKISSPLKKAR